MSLLGLDLDDFELVFLSFLFVVLSVLDLLDVVLDLLDVVFDFVEDFVEGFDLADGLVEDFDFVENFGFFLGSVLVLESVLTTESVGFVLSGVLSFLVVAAATSAAVGSFCVPTVFLGSVSFCALALVAVTSIANRQKHSPAHKRRPVPKTRRSFDKRLDIMASCMHCSGSQASRLMRSSVNSV